ncbi:methyltransferase domain-containing protein [Thermotoga profunda]|uniref:methyltransferase domain-containing protein n=1 Tax=Thermotoga profunda TaxID=1508420 RepID=UPI000693D70A|nr:methyltransferase domain-containing protein [Thermotoga profunda]
MHADSWGMKLARQISLTGQYSKEILEAFTKIPREIFCEYDYPMEVLYSDDVVITSKDGDDHSTSSQPSLMALFMKAIGISKGMKILEIGSGTGYNACVMSQIVGENGSVVGVEVNKKFFEHAVRASKSLDIGNVSFINQDGALGCEEFAPYDAIVVTVAVDRIPLQWFKQLKINGKIIVPVDVFLSQSQPAVLFEKSPNSIIAREVVETRFLKAKGLLGNLNQDNLAKLSKIQSKEFSGVIKVKHYFESEMFRLLHLTCWSLCQKDRQIYHVEETGYAVWQGKWEIFGVVEKLSKVLYQWESFGFTDSRNLKINYDENMNFMCMEYKGGMGYV